MKAMRIDGTRVLTLILVLTAVLGVGVGFTSPVFAQQLKSGAVIVNPDGKVTYLGTLGGTSSEAYGINETGRVVGRSNIVDGAQHAFITGPNGVGMTDLGTLGVGGFSHASGINDAGQVVGSSDIDTHGLSHAFITGPNGVGMTDLGTLGVGGSSYASGINDAGQVVGSSNIDTHGPSHAFITGPNGVGMTDLGTLGPSLAFGINDAGQVVGESYFAHTEYHAFITGPNGVGMTDLGTLGGTSSRAYGINDTGQVAGYSSIRAGWDFPPHAFITGPNGVGMTDLGTLGGTYSFASGINDAGQVVGGAATKELDQAGYPIQHAFITGPDGKGMIDVNSYADLPDGIVLTEARGINDLGQVIGITAIIPEPTSYALMLAGLGLIGFMARGKNRSRRFLVRQKR